MTLVLSVENNHSKQCLADLESVEMAQVKLDPYWARHIPGHAAKKFRVLAMCQIQGVVIVATSNPNLKAVTEFLTSHFDKPFRLVAAEETALRRVLGRLHQATGSPGTSLRSVLTPTGQGPQCEAVEQLNEIFRAAFLRDASDIHLVPSEHDLAIHIRVDGDLEKFIDYPQAAHCALVNRIKVMSGLNIAEKRVPQDGRFTLSDAALGPRTDVRVATIPTRFGERVTLRLLKPLGTEPTLAGLGMEAQEINCFTDAINSPNGLILLTGPTGSGKSTTLYTAITQLLKTRGGNIITVEDPIEYEIPGTSQIEVDAASKVTFAGALRSILRHDPDVIMLGEIRDSETAEMAIKAALTGHLVFSTLHTNTAAGAVTRLIDMGVEPFLIAATLRLAVAQRLVRRLCQKCMAREEIAPEFADSLGNKALVEKTGFTASGCPYCAGKGYLGRVGLFEMLRGGKKVADLISNGATESEIIDCMREANCKLLLDDGIQKILSGTTTVRQVLNAVATW